MDNLFSNEEKLGVILSYMIIYKELLDAEGLYEKLKTYSNKLDYVSAHENYEQALGQILREMTPVDLILYFRQIKNLCQLIEDDISSEFNLQNLTE